MAEDALRAEVSRRLDRPFEQVQRQLEELFDQEWSEVRVVVSTAADRGDRSEADVICDLVRRSEHKPSVHERVRREVIRWIGKPWRERTDPWDKHKHRVPGRPPPTDLDRDDLEEWTPMMSAQAGHEEEKPEDD